MTIQTETGKTVYVADGTTTSFTVPFYFFDNQIAVYKNRDFTPLVLGTDYTLTGSGQYNGGEVTFSSAPKSGDIITIVRNVELTQLVKFMEGENFPASDFEYALDKIVMALQQLRENLAQCVSIPNSSALTAADVYNSITTIEQNIDNIRAVPTIYQNILTTKTNIEQTLTDYYNKTEIATQLAGYYNKTETENKITAAKAKTFTNVTATVANAVSDATYEAYPYKLNIALTGATATSIPVVTLGLSDAVSGNFAPVANAYDGGISLYLKQAPETNFVIPSIILH